MDGRPTLRGAFAVRHGALGASLGQPNALARCASSGRRPGHCKARGAQGHDETFGPAAASRVRRVAAGGGGGAGSQCPRPLRFARDEFPRFRISKQASRARPWITDPGRTTFCCRRRPSMGRHHDSGVMRLFRAAPPTTRGSKRINSIAPRTLAPVRKTPPRKTRPATNKQEGKGYPPCWGFFLLSRQFVNQQGRLP